MSPSVEQTGKREGCTFIFFLSVVIFPVFFGVLFNESENERVSDASANESANFK